MKKDTDMNMDELLAELARLREAEVVLQARVRMETLTAEISARFINMRLEEIEDGIRQSLGTLARTTGVERAYLFLLNDDGSALDNAYEWCAAGVKAHPLGEFKGLSVDHFPWSMRHFLVGANVYVRSPDELPPEAASEKGACDMLDILSYVNVPVFNGGALAGWLGFDSVYAPKVWLEEDVVLLKVAGEAILGALGRKRRAEELAVMNEHLRRANGELSAALLAIQEKDRLLENDLKQARAFQQQLLPASPTASFFGCRTLYLPLGLVGGDMYDVCQIGQQTFRFFLADATGHGVQAALQTMVIKTEYDRIKAATEDPAQALRELNASIYRSYPDLSLPFTACCFDISRADLGEAVTGRCATAAHPGLFLIPMAGKEDPQEIRGRGSYLGMLPNLDVELVEFNVAPASRLLACTDGLLEAEGEHEEAFGAVRAADLLRLPGLELGAAVDELLRGFEAFATRKEHADDTTAVVLEFPG